jgi:hypothetical protein
MVLCRTQEEAQVSQKQGPVSMAALLMTSLTGDQALPEAYETGEQLFAVDASVDGV